MKRCSILMAVVMVCSLTGCGGTQRQRVAIDGSTSVEKVIGILSEVYSEQNPQIRIAYNPTGSGSGIRAVEEGRCDIGLSSRALTAEEAKTLESTCFAVDAIAVIVHGKNPVKNLSLAQLKQIFCGEINNWKEIGGADAPIVRIGREAASGTRDGFETILEAEEQCLYHQELTSAGDVVQTVSVNPNAIGYTSLSSIQNTVQTLAVDGVLPTVETVQIGTYAIARGFLLITVKGKPLSGAVKAFYDYATGEAAKPWIEKAGAIAMWERGVQQ